MEISGLPLHPLVVHAAVVFGPIGALAGLAYAVLPRWRDRLRIPMVALALLATGSIVAAYLTGDSFLESNPGLARKPHGGDARGPGRAVALADARLRAARRRGRLVARPSGAARLVLRVALGLAAVAVLVQVVLTGDAGARAVWERL